MKIFFAKNALYNMAKSVSNAPLKAAPIAQLDISSTVKAKMMKTIQHLRAASLAKKYLVSIVLSVMKRAALQ